MDLRTWGHLTSCLPMQVVITFHRMALRSHSLSVQLWQASAFSDTSPLPCSGLALLPALPGRWRQFVGAPDTIFQSSSLSSMLPPSYATHLFSSSFNFPTFTASHPQWTFSARGGPIWRKECVSSIHVSQVKLSCGNIYKVWSLRSPNTYSYKQNFLSDGQLSVFPCTLIMLSNYRVFVNPKCTHLFCLCSTLALVF